MYARILHALKSAMLSVCLFVATVFGANVHGQSTTIYVDINSGVHNPPNFGQNGWDSNAWTFLQDALDAANDLIDDELATEVEIWVAQGTYLPDQSAATPDGSCDPWGFCDPSATFTIPSNVRVFGGFLGSENSLEERNSGNHDPAITILSGDLGGDPDFPDSAYSNHVVTFENTTVTARLDTVTIEQGWTAGVHFDNSDAILSNCILTNNLGHGVLMINATGSGITSHPRVINCQFIDNPQHPEGGDASALRVNSRVHATVVNSLFYNNSASNGAAVAVRGNHPACPGTCVGAEADLINCTIVENVATSNGGGVYRERLGTTRLKNCILWNNSDSSGTSESAQIHDNDLDGNIEVSYSCIQGLNQYQGNENIGDDPEFVNPSQGDFRLDVAAPSPCIDSGDLVYVTGGSAGSDRHRR